ncbi:MAG: tyrosine-type recombinase/integrase [Thermosipho sp. (in: Bacteria)]|nr:tyrosine-type recombinase/integrase [Thermosipho sp. (in: thermotogales)]
MLLKFAIREFQSDREFKNLSPVTIEGYLRVLNEFHEFCINQEIVDVSDVTPSIIKSYLVHCQKKRGNNPTSINDKIRNLKIFFNFLEKEEIISEKKNPAKKIGYAKEDIKIEIFTDSQIRQMLNYYSRLKYRDKTFYAYRDYCIIYVLLGTGVRLGELVNLKWDDVDLKNGVITVFGKKRQMRSVPITKKLILELAEYKTFVQQQFVTPSEFVFTNRKNEPLTTDAVKSIFKRLKKKMNFKNVRLSAHTFRHTFCSIMIRNGCDILSLQRMLGHSSLAMVNRYYSLFGTALKEINDKHNPLNTLDL